jgi:hypothetical protein
MPAERRHAPRFPLTCPVWFIDDDGATVVRSRTENVSATGAFVTLPDHFVLPVGRRIALRMALPHEAENTFVLTSYDGAATVVRSEPAEPNAPGCLGVGIAFDTRMSLDLAV